MEVFVNGFLYMEAKRPDTELANRLIAGLGITQTELAKLAGIPEGTMSRIVRGLGGDSKMYNYLKLKKVEKEADNKEIKVENKCLYSEEEMKDLKKDINDLRHRMTGLEKTISEIYRVVASPPFETDTSGEKKRL